MKYKAAILANETRDDHILWEEACKMRRDEISYDVINLVSSGWLEKVMAGGYDVLLAKPGGMTGYFKQLYDERALILVNELGYFIYPSLREILLYENKRFLSYWLKANHISHPETFVFCDQDEALAFLDAARFPLVAKYNIGASGSGVFILNNHTEAEGYIEKAFSEEGPPRRWGPNLQSGDLFKRGLHYVKHPGDISKKWEIYKSVRQDIQQGLVILQEYIPHDFEWRVVAIGDSFFAHKKMKKGNKASGSLEKKYETPPMPLLDFVKQIMDRHDFFSQAVDLFEFPAGKYLVNEMQCIFGQSDPYQMLVDGKPGRYMHKNGRWVFMEGSFNTHESFDLRIDHVLELLKQKKR